MGTKEEDIAHVCHEANRAWCETQGDYSQPTWERAPAWQTHSAIVGVENAQRGATPEESHKCWTETKVDDGWVYGEFKDPEAKTHPCLVPYEELPEEQKRKDHLFVAIVNALS